ncbi:hypothetical protein FLL96_18730 [Vibrio cholerae]|uniref:DUF645 family protein n=1 Tax=Vibrio paracholerae TaxID=650003 RepID=A0AAX1QSQ8_9VIBR|nr:hypothetical protein [Vibrio cholerae]RBM78257.1 hypothetical protein DLR70_14300 [Vibrio paracholerae]RNE58266.1 hypothetical protein EEJ33_17230 [Vibrio cholerae]TQP07807.1 hypothetical protein FLL96_18730 [Vibrio cholerae]TQP30242.1 hypothetical protein FLL93_17630 [Vibrio cholerae]
MALDVCLSDALRKMHFKQMCLKNHW